MIELKDTPEILAVFMKSPGYHIVLICNLFLYLLYITSKAYFIRMVKNREQKNIYILSANWNYFHNIPDVIGL